MFATRQRWPAILVLFVGACGVSDPGPPPCSDATALSLSLAPGQYTSALADDTDGCFLFAANSGTQEAEYLIAPQAATGVPGRILNFVLAGTANGAAAVRIEAATMPPPPPSRAEEFHSFLRQGEETRSWGHQLMPRPAPEGAAAQIRVPKPVVGDFKSFSVCVSAGCEVFQQVGGRARAVGQHLAIFVDTAAPATGLSDADLDSLVTIFDTRLYPIDTSAFGRPSDINRDSVVMVLMTSAVNRLTPVGECSDGVVLGFFLGADIDPGFAGNPRVNHAEVIYSLVADPSGEVTCPLTVAQVKRAMPVIMIHEFQHMISYNQHVLARQGLGEVLWLNEALSHYAEELGGRSYLGEGDTATFRVYLSGDLFNAYRFLEAPHSHYLLPNPIGNLGTLAERGAQWLYVRYLVDRHAGDTTRASWNGFTRRIVETALTGASNVAFAIGEPFAQSVGRWALANWVDDLPAFTTPPELSYTSWNFRTEFARLNTNDPGRFPLPFPLVPTSSAGSAVDLSGTLRAGSAVYHRVLQAAGAPSFLLRLRAPDGYDLAPSYTPQLNVIRIR